MPIIWLGALLVIAGVVYMAGAAIWRGRMSGPPDSGDATLEPGHRGMRFLGLGPNWPGIAMMVVGAVLLLLGGIVA